MKSAKHLFLLLPFLCFSAMAANLSFKTSADFGTIEVGQVKDLTVTVTNKKMTNVRLDSHWFNETDSYQVVGGTCKYGGWTLRKGRSCQMKIRFKPTWEGSHQDSLTLGYFLGSGWTWEEINLGITGSAAVTPKGELTLTGHTDFGQLQIGEEVMHIFKLDNQTGEQVRLDEYWFNNTQDFHVDGGTCAYSGYVLASGASCDINITFRPTWEGSYNEVFTLGYYPGQTWDYKSMNLSLSAAAIKAPTTQPTPTPTDPNEPTDPVEPPQDDLWLSVSGNKILNSRGEQVILKGVNIADPQHLDTKPWERPGVTARSIASMATDEYFAKVIRLPILPGNPNYPNEGFFSATNGYDKYFNDHIKPLVDEVTSKGVYVIIDLHYISDYSNLYPRVAEFWTYMAPKFKDNPYVIYEIFNEPINPNNWNTWKDTIAQPIVNLIRQHAPKNLVLVGGPYWSSNILGAATNPVQGTNLAYVAHVYSNQTSKMWDERYLPVLQKFPVFITEWGFEEGGTEGGDITFGRSFESWMNQHKLSWTAWTFDNKWGPRMFYTDWNIIDEDVGMGTFVQGLLLDYQSVQIPFAY